MSRSSSRLFAAFGMIVSAILIIAGWDYYGDKSQFALEMPLDLKAGRTESAPFEVMEKSNYEIQFEIDPTFDKNKAQCLVEAGTYSPPSTIPIRPKNCGLGFYAPDIAWTILADGHPLQCTFFAPPSWEGIGSALDWDLCLMKMRPGVRYVAQVWFRNVAPALSQAHPRFRVTESLAGVEQGAFFSIIPTGAALLLFVAGVVQLVKATGFSVKRSRRTRA